jgi:hypothetical protein
MSQRRVLLPTVCGDQCLVWAQDSKWNEKSVNKYLLSENQFGK